MPTAAASAPSTKAATKKPKKAVSGSKGWEPAGPSITELITKAVSTSKEHKGLSLAMLRKALAASGYNVENKSCSKLGLKSLMSNGTLVQTKGLGDSGSFKVNKKLGETKEKATKKNQLPCPRSQRPRGPPAWPRIPRKQQQ
ncbi:hypothetical protein DV515_00015405 [Chloebia gouldiae]|uniref:H15 domain-containing protein n=1 Tax=Chloebia gouldiae TaxID=44316 RepID=A0A3L8RWY6_CHLGU|nr:hypothetical protein DV515_00015405 [Chloebia gouldiae]